jgi:TIR domain
MTARARKPRYEVFISHSSVDRRAAAKVELALQEAHLAAWLDRSDIRVGTLLRDELHGSIKASRVVVLLWSKAAAASRWVAAEVLTAFHEKRFIVPCVLDATRLPYFLENAIFLGLRPGGRRALASVVDAVRKAPRGANRVPPFRDSPGPELTAAVRRLSEGQRAVTDALGGRDLASGRRAQKALDPAQRRAEKAWPLDATVLSLGGYHRKNAYMLKHWDAIQAGRPPKDPLLVKAERFFFETLFVNPVDFNALNGLGSILLYERDLDAALFFVRRALHYAARAGVSYEEAKHDLELLRWLKSGAR